MPRVKFRGCLYVLILLCWCLCGDGQSCFDTVNVQQQGSDRLNTGHRVIVPSSNFNCNGRITGYMVSLNQDDDEEGDYPRIQVWRPEAGSQVYNRIDQYTLSQNDINRRNNYYLANVAFTGSSRIEFQSGDIIGYYQPSDPRYTVWSVQTSGYNSYSLSGRSSTTFSLNSANNDEGRQPLIQVSLDVRCDDLSMPANGQITSCTSGTIGVGYETESCSYMCNTGYELTGSDTRTCQTSGSWTGTDDVCRRVPCPSLTDPNNGMVTCSLGDDGVPSYEDTCSFTCNTGYELTGSDTRTCQSDGSWSGNDTLCTRVTCPSLTDPNNGMVTCSLGDDGVPSYEDTCSFTCNTGYELTGNDTRTCQSDGSWSGSNAVCTRVLCPSLMDPINGTGSCSLGDDGILSYEDTCIFMCDTGYELTGSEERTCQSDGIWNGSDAMCSRVPCPSLTDPNNGTITCSLGDDGVPSYEDVCAYNLTCGVGYDGDTRTCQNDGTWSGTDMCIRVPCPSLTDPNNGMITCSLGDDGVPSYEDTCNFTCNTGYELTGSDTRTCQSDGSWSGSEAMCTRVSCLMLSNPNNGMITCSLGDDGVPSYEDTCSFTCNTGYELTGSDTRACQSDGSWSGNDTLCTRVTCPSLTDLNNGTITCSLGDDGVLSYEDACNFTCNTGYELAGSDTRICQSDGSWSGTDALCIRVPCPPLTDPVNGTITCSLGDDGNHSYEDICSFTCNNGYELTGSGDSRTCQRNGSWSGNDAMCARVPCPSLTDPNNGVITCSLGDDGVPSYEDTCSFTCNTGYELTGSSSRMCQSDENWSSNDTLCTRVPCPTLSDPNNGVITCSLGDDGVPSYEDTCNFTCNTGYELTGSDTRTCQSDRSWSGSDVMCMRVPCPSLTDPNNGMITCSLGDDGVPSYEDTCSFTCNTGYELTGSDTRTCQSDGSWSDSDDVCRRVRCPSLANPNNGVVTCLPGDDGIPSFEDICNFTCNTGYELTGSDTRTCQSDGSWSGVVTSCPPLNCSSQIINNVTISQPSCNQAYQSQCTLSCSEGYTGDGVTYLCNVTSDPTIVEWVPIGGVDVMCERAPCPSPTGAVLECPNGATNGVFEDTCTFSCNPGYVLQGSNSRMCLADQSWSGGDPICAAVNCPTSPPVDNSQVQSPCNTQYESTCTTVCVDGYTGGGGSYTCVVTDVATNSVGWNGSTTCERVRCSSLTDPDNGMMTLCSLGDDGVPSYEDTCNFTCNTDYKLTGSNNRTCQGDGSWSGNDVVCKSASSGSSGSSPGAIAAGVIIGIAVVAIVCVVLILIVYKQRRKRKYSINDHQKDHSLPSSYTNAVAMESPTSTMQVQNDLYSECDNKYDLVTSITMPNYDYIDDSVAEQTPFVESEGRKSSAASVNIYHIPEGSTLKFMNKSKATTERPSVNRSVKSVPKIPDPNPYEIPQDSIYQDPGMQKEKIYEWFEKKKYRKLKQSDLQIHHQIGSGEFGIVSLAQWHDESTNASSIVAVKSISDRCSETEKVKFLREAAIMGQFLHNNVVRLHGVVTEEEKLMIVLEYMPKGDLREYLLKISLKKGELYSDGLPNILQLFSSQIASGMNYLANKQFVHRDLAARNILISGDNVCKIADFGMARDITDSNYYVTKGGKIPAKWTPPEALLYQKYSVKSDIWSYGCVLYEIWSLGHKPFESKSTDDMIKLVCSGHRLPPPPGCPRQIYQIMIGCWNPDANERPLYPNIISDLNAEDALVWSEEDKQIAGAGAAVLGNPLTDGYKLYIDLQSKYKE
ncbi:uncharacterized protein [Dysidea avara]|uniref:uncharacterized protein n=1 Tax=Dysidea avara TaxID=196820 RepID=UPI0033291D92